jgi:hypothetical protein
MAVIADRTEEACLVREIAENGSSSSSRGRELAGSIARPRRHRVPVGFLTKMLPKEFLQALKKLEVIY